MRSARNLLLVVALGRMAIAVPALAQQASDYPTPCDASKVTRADVDRAHTVFLSGKQFLEESNYDKAIGYFKDAYSIDCSVHAMLPIIATAYERKGDKAEAVRALEEYVRRAPNAPDHDVIERRIKNMKDQLARDQPVASAPVTTAPAQTPPSQPTVTANAEPTPAASSSLPPAAGSTLPPGEQGHGALPWVVVGVGGIAVVTGIILYAAGAGDVSSAQAKCPSRICSSAAAQDQGNSGRTLENIGGGVIGGGLAVAAAGLVWHFLEKPAYSPGGTSSRARLIPAVAPGYAGFTLDRTF